jgi:hypothetical protein
MAMRKPGARTLGREDLDDDPLREKGKEEPSHRVGVFVPLLLLFQTFLNIAVLQDTAPTVRREYKICTLGKGKGGVGRKRWRNPTRSVGRVMSKDELLLPKFDYYIDESDPDIVILRRPDGSFVAAFSARGATREGIVEAAKEDYRGLVEVHASSLNHQQEKKKNQQRSA